MFLGLLQFLVEIKYRHCPKTNAPIDTFVSLCSLRWIIQQSLQWVIMYAMATQATGVLIVYSTVCSGADQRKHQSSASLAFAMGIHQWPMNSPHKGPVTRKILPFDDVDMIIWWMLTRITKQQPELREPLARAQSWQLIMFFTSLLTICIEHNTYKWFEASFQSS